MRNQANVEFRQPGTKLIVWHHAGQAHVGVAQELQDRRVGVGGTDQYNLAVAEAISHARQQLDVDLGLEVAGIADGLRSEEHTSELQSLMRISYAVFCLKKKLILVYFKTFFLI